MYFNKYYRYLLTLKPIFAFLLLTLFGLWGNLLGIPLNFGVNFIFGSIAVMVIVYIYGTLCGTLASIIIYVLWMHYSLVVLFYSKYMQMDKIQMLTIVLKDITN